MDRPRLAIALLAVTLTMVVPRGGPAQSVPTGGEKNALVLVITKWNDDCDDASNASYLDDIIRSWYSEITDDRSAPSGHGSSAWREDGFNKNGDRKDSEYVDSDRQSFGNDDRDDNVDGGDAVFIGMHGSHQGTSERWWGYVRVNEAGEGNCAAWQGGMLLGDYDAEFLHNASCHSMCRRNWWPEGSNVPEWFDSFAGLHQMNGIHGLNYNCLLFASRYKDFAEDAFVTSIAESWIDNVYYEGNIYTHGNDVCPVSISVGNGYADALARISLEQYDFVFSDCHNPTDLQAIWVGLCNPGDENTLPDN